jgi:hypothetical protein
VMPSKMWSSTGEKNMVRSMGSKGNCEYSSLNCDLGDSFDYCDDYCDLDSCDLNRSFGLKLYNLF